MLDPNQNMFIVCVPAGIRDEAPAKYGMELTFYRIVISIKSDINTSKCVLQNASLPSWRDVDHSNDTLIYYRIDPLWFYLCLMLFLKLSHQSSWIKRKRRWYSLPPLCISAFSFSRHSPCLGLTSCLQALTPGPRFLLLPLNDPLRYI